MQKLSIESEFEIRSFNEKIKNGSKEELYNLSCQLFREMMIQRKTFERMIGEAWGVLPKDTN